VEPERIDGLKNLSGYREGEPFYAVQRFDRTGNGGRRHIEDFAQVFNLRTHQKYGQANYEQIGRTLLQYAGGVEDVREFARRLAFNVLMGNGDAHVKNWSLIYDDPSHPRLAPAYDLVPTIAYMTTDQTIALNMGGTRNFKEISLETFDNFLRRIGLLDQVRKNVIDTVVDTGRNILTAWENFFVEMNVPSELTDQVKKHQRSLRLASDIQR
jgi:serine/threonine-protein kinase HipA